MTNRAYVKSNGDGLLCSILCQRPVHLMSPDLHQAYTFTLYGIAFRIGVAARKSTYPIRNVQLSEAELKQRHPRSPLQ
jgi:hypothetical protein